MKYWLYIYFENVNEALHEAGLESSPLAKKYATTNDELLKYLWDLSLRNDKIPSTLDINRDRKYNYRIFLRRFHSIKEAYEIAKVKFGSKASVDEKLLVPKPLEVIVSESTLVGDEIPIKEDEFKGNFYGVAAENLVVSELLYRGYESYLINVDLGLDVFAYKDGKPFYIQVKNVSLDNSDTRTIPITKSSYSRNKFNNVYYFFVIQKKFKRDYIIIPLF